MLAAYPSLPAADLLGRPLAYADYVQLWLNLPRQLMRRGAAVALGLNLAWGDGGSDDLLRGAADALASSDGEAEELEFQMRARAAEARARARRGV